MAQTKPKPIDYQALQQELDEIMAALQADDSNVDTALERYARGLEIIKLLQAHLKTAGNIVQTLKASFDQ